MSRLARVGVLFGLGLVACGGGIARETLPSEPIAFIRQEPRMGIASLDEFMGSIEFRVRDPGEESDPAGASGRTSISLLTASTGELRTLPDSEVGSIPLDWSPDGLYLLIGRPDPASNALQLFSWNRLTGARERLTTDPVFGGAAFGEGPIRLAHVGRPLVAGIGASRRIQLRVDRLGTQLLPDSEDGDEPDVAPDGRTVVFVRRRPRARRDPIILLGELGGEMARPIARGSSPRYSRDGNWIAYVTRRAGNADVWLMRADGSSKRAVASSAYDEEYPSPSPDGRFVVYSAARGGQDQLQIYLTRVDDQVEIQLTQNGQNGRPVW